MSPDEWQRHHTGYYTEVEPEEEQDEYDEEQE